MYIMGASRKRSKRDTRWAGAAKKALRTTKGDYLKKLITKLKRSAPSRGYAVSTVEKWVMGIAKTEPKTKKKSKQTKARTIPTSNTVKKHARHLTKLMAEKDVSALSDYINALSKDRNFTKADALALAHAVEVEYSTSGTRKGALAAIQKTHNSRVYSRSRDAMNAKVAPW